MPSQSSQFFKLKLSPWGLLSVGGTLVCIFTICGFFGRFCWLLDDTVHFRAQYAVLLLAVAVPYAIARKFKPALVFVCFAIVNAAVVLPYCFAGHGAAGPFDSKIRVVLINVHTENQNTIWWKTLSDKAIQTY